jgi:hypothetical protein
MMKRFCKLVTTASAERLLPGDKLRQPLLKIAIQAQDLAVIGNLNRHNSPFPLKNWLKLKQG